MTHTQWRCKEFFNHSKVITHQHCNQLHNSSNGHMASQINLHLFIGTVLLLLLVVVINSSSLTKVSYQSVTTIGISLRKYNITKINSQWTNKEKNQITYDLRAMLGTFPTTSGGRDHGHIVIILGNTPTPLSLLVPLNLLLTNTAISPANWKSVMEHNINCSTWWGMEMGVNEAWTPGNNNYNKLTQIWILLPICLHCTLTCPTPHPFLQTMAHKHAWTNTFKNTCTDSNTAMYLNQ